MTVLIVVHYSSPGPSVSQSARRLEGYVNPFLSLCSDVRRELSINYPGIALKWLNRTEINPGPFDYPISSSRSKSPVRSRQFLDPSTGSNLLLVLRAVNVPSIKKYRFLKRKLFVTVSNSKTTAKTADVSAEGHMVKWNQNLNAL